MLSRLLLFLAGAGLTFAGTYLESPPFSSTTGHGMSRARSPTYDYEYDPEMVLGYSRQDTRENGTVVSADGNYFLVKDNEFYIRIDARDCKRFPEEMPRICFCYKSVDDNAKDDVCNSVPGFVHFCQHTGEGTKLSGTCYKDNGHVNQLGDYSSYHINVIINNKNDVSEIRVVGTNNLAGGLHQANKDYYNSYANAANFPLVNISVPGLPLPLVSTFYVLGKNNVTARGIELKFPIKNKVKNCVRLDFNGLMYAGKLIDKQAAEAKMPVYKVPYTLKGSDEGIRPEGTREAVGNEATRPNPVGVDTCDFPCCPFKA